MVGNNKMQQNNTNRLITGSLLSVVWLNSLTKKMLWRFPHSFSSLPWKSLFDMNRHYSS